MTDWKALCEELLGLWDAQPLPPYESSWASVIARTRAVIAADRARWSHQPAPPAAGEVAELVAWLRSTGEGQPCLSDEGYARLTRAADLLEQQATAYAICERERLHQSTRAAEMFEAMNALEQAIYLLKPLRKYKKPLPTTEPQP